MLVLSHLLDYYRITLEQINRLALVKEREVESWDNEQ